MSVFDAVKLLMPPGKGDDPTKWRWTMFGAIIAMAVVGGLHSADVWPAHEKYATADQFQALLNSQKDGRAEQTARAIFNLRIRHCAESDAEKRRFLFRLIGDERRAYQKITGREYALPGCDEI